MLELQAEVGCLALLPKAWFRLPRNKQPSKSTKVPRISSDASDLEMTDWIRNWFKENAWHIRLKAALVLIEGCLVL